MTLDTTHMDLADLEGSLSDLPEEMKFALATSLLGQYLGGQQGPDDAFLIVRTNNADLGDHHDLHHHMAQALAGVGRYRNLLSSLGFRAGVDDKLGWTEARPKQVRKALSRTAGAFGHSIN